MGLDKDITKSGANNCTGSFKADGQAETDKANTTDAKKRIDTSDKPKENPDTNKLSAAELIALAAVTAVKLSESASAKELDTLVEFLGLLRHNLEVIKRTERHK